MEEKKQRGEGKKKGQSRRKKKAEAESAAKEETKEIKESRETREETREMREEGAEKQDLQREIQQQQEESAEIRSSFSTSQGSSSFLSQKIKEISNRINTQIMMIKGAYMMFQGLRQSYGGDTKKALSVVFGFVKDEGKRRINELKEKIRKKIMRGLD